MSGDKIDMEGIVSKACGNGMFLIAVDDTDIQVSCTLSGKIRKNNIRILEGDRVKIEVSVYDTSKGRITYRTKKPRPVQSS